MLFITEAYLSAGLLFCILLTIFIFVQPTISAISAFIVTDIIDNSSNANQFNIQYEQTNAIAAKHCNYFCPFPFYQL